MRCSICNLPIVLVPSAKERARKSGKTPGYYTRLFTTHAECAIAQRERETSALIRRLNAERGKDRDSRLLTPKP